MSTISTLYKKHGSSKLAVDYLKARDLAKADMITKGGWNSLSVEDKYTIIRFFLEDPGLGDTAANNTAKVTFLMNEGKTLGEAQGILASSYGIHHEKEIKSCEKRANSVAVSTLVATYLNLDDARDFIETTKTLYDLFRTQGIKGINYGSVGEGLLDFIESTVGSSFEFIGLAQQGYTVKTGTINDLVTGLVDILINGNYTS